MDKRLKQMLKMDIQVERNSGSKTAAGEILYDAPTTIKGKTEFRETVLRDKLGDEVYSKSRTFFAEDAVVEIGDLVTLPDGRKYPVISISRKYDADGHLDHLVVYS